MACRFSARELTAALLATAIALSGCNAPANNETPATRAQSDPEEELRDLAEAMQRTVLEGALAGAAIGTTIGFSLGGANRKKNTATGFTFGLGAGAAAGSYVAYLQKEYATKEKRLDRLREDLDANNAEIATTLGVMREVLRVQREELNQLRARVRSGSGENRELASEIEEAKDNLAQMQKAIDGAAGRQAEFAQTRGLELADTGGSGVENELDELASRISAMRAVASDLATQI